MANVLQRAANEAQRGALTEARARELLSEILQSVSGEHLRVFTVKDWLEHFVKQKRESRSARTAKMYEQVLNDFLGFLGNRSRLNIAAITSRDIADFRDSRRALGLAPATLNLDVRILSAVFNSAWKQGHVSVNPCLAVEDMKDYQQQRKDTFLASQVTALVKAAKGEWKGLILTAFYTGARLHDCANLRWRNVDLLSEIKTIRFVQGKTGREIVTVIHPALEDYLLSLPAAKSDDAFLFPSLAERVTSPLSKEFREIMQQARIEQRVIRERNEDGSGRSVSALSFHSLRHSFSSLLANSGIPEEVRMELVGHTTRAMQRHYTHRDLSVLREAVAVLPRI